MQGSEILLIVYKNYFMDNKKIISCTVFFYKIREQRKFQMLRILIRFSINYRVFVKIPLLDIVWMKEYDTKMKRNLNFLAGEFLSIQRASAM